MQTKLAVRALIIHNGKILLVKHPGSDFYALPGGKLDENEDLKSGLVRELHEELGVKAEIGPLRYIQDFFYPKGSYSLEFFYEVANPEAFVEAAGGTHAAGELEEIIWVEDPSAVPIKPDFLQRPLGQLQQDWSERVQMISVI